MTAGYGQPELAINRNALAVLGLINRSVLFALLGGGKRAAQFHDSLDIELHFTLEFI